MPRRGDSAGKACGTSYLFPLHYSLKNLPLSTWVCAFEKAPTVNPSVKNQRFLPAPFSKGAFGCAADTGRVREVAIRRKPPCAMTAAARRPFGKGAFGGGTAPKRTPRDAQGIPGGGFTLVPGECGSDQLRATGDGEFQKNRSHQGRGDDA